MFIDDFTVEQQHSYHRKHESKQLLTELNRSTSSKAAEVKNSPLVFYYLYSFPGNLRKIHYQNGPCWKATDALEEIAALNSFSSLFCILGRGNSQRWSRHLTVGNWIETADGWCHLERTGLWSQTEALAAVWPPNNNFFNYANGEEGLVKRQANSWKDRGDLS